MTTSFSIEIKYLNTILALPQVLKATNSPAPNYLFMSILAGKS